MTNSNTKTVGNLTYTYSEPKDRPIERIELTEIGGFCDIAIEHYGHGSLVIRQPANWASKPDEIVFPKGYIDDLIKALQDFKERGVKA